MTLQQLRYFVELAHTHNYSLAAQRLYITQPTLSYSIAQLEQELGVRLIQKSGRNNVLTEYGKRFLSYAEGAVRTIDAGVTDLIRSVHEYGVIRLGFLRYLGIRYVPYLVKEFTKAHPDYHISFEFETGSTALLLDGLNSGRFDAAICAPSRSISEDAILIGRQKLYCITPKDHPLAECESVTPEQIFQYPLVWYAKGSSMRNILERYLSPDLPRAHIRFELYEEQTVAGFVAEGFGVGIVPELDLFKTLPLRVIEIETPCMERDVYMIPSRIRESSPILELFLKFAKSHPF